jgi:hypothetical protein
MTYVREKFGKRFVGHVEIIANFSGRSEDENIEDLAATLTSLKTKRGVVRYLENLLDKSKFNDLDRDLWNEIVTEADKDPYTYENTTGVFVNDVRVDSSKLFTDNIEEIYDILKNAEYTEIDEFLVRVGCRHEYPEWVIIEVDSNNHLDVYRPGGTRVDWETLRSDVEWGATDRHYGMVYIPNMLWCFAPLYDQAVERITKKFGRFFPTTKCNKI